ncbi:MAG: hypothetical protein A2075_02710 [Geobacteraceae bacterium GWC2_58_44]|nr:MAG: hypothetical protein A2075_02710 [Geobacteraceae bacterium GWC2_58_44]HBG05172.1 hypothetical protein [Geobacter sp.]
MLSIIKRRLRPLRSMLAVLSLLRSWRRQVAALDAATPAPHRGGLQRVVIFPPDPEALLGSKGDEALIVSLLASLRRIDAALEICIVTQSEQASADAGRLGCRPLMVWRERGPLQRSAAALAGADGVVVVGADIMDGYYSPVSALQRWLLLDLAARQGKRSVVIGCSFNGRPSPYLARALHCLDHRVAVNLRDPLSFARFQPFSGAASRLVADIAFLLPPDNDSAAVAEVRGWVESQQLRQQSVLGFNIHYLLYQDCSEPQMAALVATAAEALARLLESHTVSVLLIPHDYRGSLSDAACLSRIFDALEESFARRVYFRAEPMTAAELKAVAGCTDLMVTGRMHLAIAALGQGKPVGALTYQDKFHGLFKLFGLPDWLLLDPAALQGDRLYLMMERLLRERHALAAEVQRELPGVIELSRRNMLDLLPADRLQAAP